MIELLESDNPLPIILFLALTLFVISLISGRISGWRALAEQYRGEVESPLKTLRFQSTTMRGKSNYISIITVKIGAEALGLSVFLPFRLSNATLAIPWDEIMIAEGGEYTELTFHSVPDVPMKVSPDLVAQIREVRSGNLK